MRGARKRELVWRAAGWLCYLVGLLLVLLVAVGAYLSPPEGSFANVSTVDLVVLLAGVGLIVGGRVVAMTLGGSREMAAGSMGMFGDSRPEQSRLEELGYNIPPESTDGTTGGRALEDGELVVVCPNCGERNDDAFDYCGNCSAELPN